MTRTVPAWARAAGGMFAVGWGANQFTSLLVAYRDDAGVSVAVSQALFGFYALGLIPVLFVAGPASDRFGRRAVARAAAVTSLAATLVLMFGPNDVAALYVGRLLAGIASGAIFAPGTAWVKELSSPPIDLHATEQAGARRAAVALSAGFGAGPLVAGLIGQWSPAPLVVAYVPHLVILAVAAVLLWHAPETVTARSASIRAGLRVRSVRLHRFRTVVVPSAPWVFLSASVAMAVLPGVVARHTHGLDVAFAAVMPVATLGVGVLIQPFARRLDAVDDVRGLRAGLASITVGCLVGALAAATADPLIALAAGVLLGAGYGLVLVSGLLEVQRMVPPAELAGLTSMFWALTYLGFAAPLVLAELDRFASYTVLLACTGGLALVTMLVVSVRRPVSVPSATLSE